MSAEPRDVGPLYGGDQPVLDTDRQLVVTLLRAAQADGRMTELELTTRLQAVQYATTFDDLVPITRDLM
ncbi:MAG: DUF1707 domain-containing protein [Propionibacteriaceae bacterium]|jgi:hypothetical protein|nr:DUF1707 domain-containing protein [Propionibacteriaceae bacterium]